MAFNASQDSDMQTILRAAFDPANQSLKQTLAASIALAINATSDSITSVGQELADKATVPNGTLTSTVVIGPVSAVGVKNFELVTNTTSTLTATSPLLTLQWSPSDTDNVWISSALTVIPSTGAGVVAGTQLTVNGARRVQVVLTHSGYTVGSFDGYLVGKA